MHFENHAAKVLLSAKGNHMPLGKAARPSQETAQAAAEIAPCVVKAQTPTGERDKAGCIKCGEAATDRILKDARA